jgi:Resolvase, N terminal domain
MPGFGKAENRNSVSYQQFQPKSFNDQTLMPSGYSSLFLVVPRRGGGQPGQIRDKWQQGPIVAAGPECAPLPGGLPDRIPFVLASSGRRPSRSRRKGPRSRAETEAERRQRREEAEKEIVPEFHSLLSRDQAKAVGAVYARYSSQFQHSIGDQVRSLFEVAVKQSIFVPREYVFCDLAVRGYKDSRPGLDQLRAILARRAIQVLLVFTTNRLFRKVYKALQFVEEEIIKRGIRCLFVKSNIDTADASGDAGAVCILPPFSADRHNACDLQATGDAKIPLSSSRSRRLRPSAVAVAFILP